MNMRNPLFLPGQVVVFIVLFWLNMAYAQKNPGKTTNVDQYLSALPKGLTLQEKGSQKYRVTTNWLNRDLYGNTTGKFIITGEYTRGLEIGFVRWNNVQIAVFQDPTKPNSDTLSQEWMEGFSYKSPDDIARVDFFKNFPTDETRHLLRTLIWDAIGIETFAWTYFDKLRLNEFYRASDFEEFTVQMAGWGTLKMKDLKLKWTGISKMNDETCAVIQYESFANPIKSISMIMAVKGRSLYWGCIWVSLEMLRSTKT